MGAGIAYVAASAGFDVDLVEVDAVAPAARWRCSARAGTRRAPRQISTRRGGRSSPFRIDAATSLTRSVTGPTCWWRPCPKSWDLKRTCSPRPRPSGPRLLGSNTSSIPIGELAVWLKAPERFIGLHFFNPVWAMALLEIVVGPATADARPPSGRRAGRIGWARIRSWYGTCPASRRPGWAWRWAWRRSGWSRTAWPSAADIDKAMVLGYRHPMGPLELTDHRRPGRSAGHRADVARRRTAIGSRRRRCWSDGRGRGQTRTQGPVRASTVGGREAANDWSI